MHSGNFLLALHTHLPWVLHHGKSPHGEDWLNEAIAECYLPLLNAFNELLDEGIKAKVTIDISPILCEQLEHEDGKNYFIGYCDEKIHAANEDEKKFKSWGYDPHHIYLAQYWQQWFTDRKSDFIIKYDRSIINGLRDLQDKGAIEIATCGATHGYMPLLATENSIELQIKAAVENYKKHFKRTPRGIWLPECAYRPSYEWKSLLPIAPFHFEKLRPGIEQFLKMHGIDYFFTDQDLTNRAQPIGVYLDSNRERFVPYHSEGFERSLYNFENMEMQPFWVSSSPEVEYGTAAVYTRHHDIAMQVWSGAIGYPAEPDYLDFHKKEFGSHLRYWRVTDSKADMMYKSLYHPDWVKDKIDLQSNHFIHHIENTLNWYNNEKGKFGTLCAPFDTELFGHWWFEGPQFVKAVIRGLHHSPYVNSATCSEQLFLVKPKEVMTLPEGSWGVSNNHEVWSNDENKWTWEAIYNNENRLSEIYQKAINSSDALVRRLIRQALKEMMLLHSSDWQFLIYTESARDYAEQRFMYHHSDFNRLLDLCSSLINGNQISNDEKKYLEETELRNSIFQELKEEWWSDRFIKL